MAALWSSGQVCNVHPVATSADWPEAVASLSQHLERQLPSWVTQVRDVMLKEFTVKLTIV